MVKSNVRAMAKGRRKVVEITPEFLKELEEIDRRIEEHDRKAAETLAKVAQLQGRLREIYAGR